MRGAAACSGYDCGGKHQQKQATSSIRAQWSGYTRSCRACSWSGTPLVPVGQWHARLALITWPAAARRHASWSIGARAAGSCCKYWHGRISTYPYGRVLVCFRREEGGEHTLRTRAVSGLTFPDARCPSSVATVGSDHGAEATTD
jgi:hypothetical protein